MTMPFERTTAVLQTKEFLQMLARAEEPAIPERVRREAHRLLRHFPNKSDLQFAAYACHRMVGATRIRVALSQTP